MSQTEVGNHVGITFQQLQKYEKGTNRVYFSRLVQLADALHTTPEQLMADVRQEITPTSDALAPQVDVGDSRQTLQLVRLAHAVPSHTLRPVLNLLRSIADAAPNDTES